MIKTLFDFLTGAVLRLSFDGGGSSAPAPAAPTNQTVTQTSIPEYARPYVETMLGKAQALTEGDKFQQYGGERIAGFSPLQQQAFQGIAGMAPAGQIGQGTALAGTAGLGGLMAGGNYAQMATDPSQIQAYMSPYMQNVVDIQQREAGRQADIARTQRQAQATGAGAFGGSRQAIVEAEANRNLARQMGDIQAQGLQSAFQNAQQAQQFGANLGLQGLGLAGQQAGILGQLGQTQYGQQMGINTALQQAGAQQQALEQQRLQTAYQDFLNQQRFPYQQIGFMSDVIRGMPLTQQSQSVYQAPPSASNQLMAYGLGAYGLSNLFGGRKAGGEIKAYAGGGGVDSLMANRATAQAMRLTPDALRAARDGSNPAIEPWIANRAMTAQAVQRYNDANKLMDGVAALSADNIPDDRMMADGGIVAFQEGGWNREYATAAQDEDQGYSAITPWSVVEEGVRQGNPKAIAYAEERLRKGPGLFGIAPPETLVDFMSKRAAAPATSVAGGPMIRPPSTAVAGSEYGPGVAQIKAEDKKSAAKRAATSTTAPAAPAATATPSIKLTPYEERGIEGLMLTPEDQMAAIKKYATAAGELTRPQREALEKAYADRNAKIAGQGEDRLRTARGLAALEAAAAITRPGQTKAGAVGAGFGAAAKVASEYKKEEAKIQDKLEDADLALQQAQLAYRQNDVKLGASLMQSANDDRTKAAEAAGKLAYQKAMVGLENSKLSLAERKEIAEDAERQAKIKFLYPSVAAENYATAAYRRAAATSPKGTLTEKNLADIADKAEANVAKLLSDNPQVLSELRKQYPGKSILQLREILYNTEFQRLRQQEGISAPVAPSRLLSTLPESAEIGGKI